MTPSSLILAGIYARVSSDQQADDGTIASQLAALRKRAEEDGCDLASEREFIDDGYSGASLVRPALERVRDVAAMGGLDRLYVHSPDRLARKYAYQVLLIDEMKRFNVEVVFLNRDIGQSPEDDLLLQVQGMVAEYERAKILERSRRGKRHAAACGQVSVLANAPYGYRYVSKRDGGGEGKYVINEDEAAAVKCIFEWVGRDRLTIQAVCRRLAEQGVRTRTGKEHWDRTTVWGILKNPAYQGTAAYGKTRTGSPRPRLRPSRGAPAQPKRPVSTYAVPPEEWVMIPVPAIVDEDLFATVQEQLEENRKRARVRQRGARYLLQGLVVCRECGYAYYGKPVSISAGKGKRRRYAYYRCVGSDAYRFGGERLCFNGQIRTDRLDEAVWDEVRHLLADPGQVEREYQRRLSGSDPESEAHARGLKSRLKKCRQAIGRLIDSYTEGHISKDEFEPRIGNLKDRARQLEVELREQAATTAVQKDLQDIVGRLESFASEIKDNLESLSWERKREIIRTLVRRIEIDKEGVEVIFKVDPVPFVTGHFCNNV